MPIRFYCTGCNKPIEIDDEFANRLVACPFCSATVTAPAASVQELVASPLGGPPATSQASRPTVLANEAPTHSAGRRYSTIGLVCGLLLWAIPVAAYSIAFRQVGAFGKLQAAQTMPAEQQSEVVKSITQEHEKLLEAWGKKHPWLSFGIFATYALLLIAGLAASVVGLLQSPTRKGRALIGLLLCGVCGSCMALNIIGAAMGGAAAGGGS